MNRLLAIVLASTAALTAVPASAQPADTLTSVLASERRAEDRARDQWRHPRETLAFFRIEPGMTVVEYSPGGGWYTRVLAPWLNGGDGRYLAVNADTEGREYRDAAAEQTARGWPAAFPARAAEWTGVPATSVTAFESDSPPSGIAGSVDRVLIFRNIHSMLGAGNAESEIANLRALLADDGMIGVVQHRAPEDDSAEDADGSRGYVKQSDVIALFGRLGFELVDQSEINANPRDTADWPDGVWTLPPSYALGDTDRARYEAIGESDRMTLLFRKAE